MGVKARLKGARKAGRDFLLSGLTEADKAILVTYYEASEVSGRDWGDSPDDLSNKIHDDAFYFQQVWGLTEHYLEIAYPDEEVEGTPQEKFKTANASVFEMWEVVKPDVLYELREIL